MVYVSGGVGGVLRSVFDIHRAINHWGVGYFHEQADSPVTPAKPSVKSVRPRWTNPHRNLYSPGVISLWTIELAVEGMVVLSR